MHLVPFTMQQFLALLLMHLTLTPLCWAIWRQQLPFQLTPQSIPPTVVVVNDMETQPTVDMQQQHNTFTLQSVYHHASSSGPIPGLFRKHSISKDTFNDQGSLHQQQYDIQSLSGTTYRPVSIGDVYSMYRHQRSWLHTSSPVHVEFKQDQGFLPDTKHRPTILSLAMMTNNAYSPADNSSEWYDLGAPWNVVCIHKGKIYPNADYNIVYRANHLDGNQMVYVATCLVMMMNPF